MNLEEAHILGYKSIRHLEFEPEDLSVFIGRNDAGKSAILEALHFALTELEKPDPTHFHKNDAEEITVVVKFSDVPTELRDKLSADYGCEGDSFELKKEYYETGSGAMSQTTYINGEKLLAGAVVIEGEELGKKDSRREIWKFLPTPIYVPAERDPAEQTKLKGGTFLNELLMPVLEASGVNDAEIRQNKESLEDALSDASDRITEELTGYMSEQLADLEEVSLNMGEVQISKAVSPSIEVQDEHLEDAVHIGDRGSGVGSILILALLKAYANHRVGENYLLMFEEPGNSLHPGAQRKMLSSFRKIVESGGTVAFSTHSPVFIDEAEKGLYLVKRDEGETSVSELGEDVYDAIREIESRPSDLLQCDYIVYTEGPSDAGMIREIGRRAIEGWEEKNVVVLPLGGAIIEHCSVEDLEMINPNFAVVLDSDKESEDDAPNQIAVDFKEKCEERGKMCLILSKKEIENYFTPEAINAALGRDVGPDFVSDYADMKAKIRAVSGEYSPMEGIKVVRKMYREGERVDEIEEFLTEFLN